MNNAEKTIPPESILKCAYTFSILAVEQIPQNLLSMKCFSYYIRIIKNGTIL